ncbi:hypothetical protein NC653_022033 [Populus alba x Populus x berolinensis]|uniref:Uncharacterized protein n=1 Tax=Populus alba x Populus x berolinensis TaxID=444605 RepID=A0AAD6VTV8_9ROSI|nr:hypothetical protein NC653_022033 [Populus alba x Populus x berolinensis]
MAALPLPLPLPSLAYFFQLENRKGVFRLVWFWHYVIMRMEGKGEEAATEAPGQLKRALIDATAGAIAGGNFAYRYISS